MVSCCKCVINHLLHVVLAPGLQHEPELEGVHLPAALHALVPGVVAHIVELVLLEQIGGVGRVGLVQQPGVANNQS